MYKLLRKKVASSVTNVDSPDHFEWERWLRAPGAESHHIEKIFSSIENSESLNEWITLPSSESFEAKIKLPHLFDKTRTYVVPKPRTNKVFFKHAANESKIVFFSSIVKKKSESFLNMKEKNTPLKSLKLSALIEALNVPIFEEVLVKKIKKQDHS